MKKSIECCQEDYLMFDEYEDGGLSIDKLTGTVYCALLAQPYMKSLFITRKWKTNQSAHVHPPLNRLPTLRYDDEPRNRAFVERDP